MLPTIRLANQSWSPQSEGASNNFELSSRPIGCCQPTSGLSLPDAVMDRTFWGAWQLPASLVCAVQGQPLIPERWGWPIGANAHASLRSQAPLTQLFPAISSCSQRLNHFSARIKAGLGLALLPRLKCDWQTKLAQVGHTDHPNVEVPADFWLNASGNSCLT